VKNKKIIVNLLSVLVAVWLILEVSGCKSEPLSVPPPPQITTVSPTKLVTSTPDQTLTVIKSATTTSTVTPSSTAAETNIAIVSNTAVEAFPDKITFSLKGNSPETIQAASIEYGTDERSLTTETNRTEIEFTKSTNIDISWGWEMKKSGSIPPGATVWWRWVLTGANGKTFTVPKKTLFYTDTRFTWQVKKLTDMDIYWQGKDETLVNTLANEVQTRLARIQLNITIPAERKPKVFVYSSSEELRGAVLFQQEWTGALAYTTYNIVLTAVNTSNIEWAKGALPHEITHLMVREAIFGPFGNIPLWLNEGLAKYSEGPMTDDYKQILNTAIANNTLITIQSLSSSFPTASSGAYLAYAESNSIVSYLINTYGWEKMRNLLSIFKEGSTNDKALQSVYSLDVNGLDVAWRASLKAK
jgi:hypothetical protein